MLIFFIIKSIEILLKKYYPPEPVVCKNVTMQQYQGNTSFFKIYFNLTLHLQMNFKHLRLVRSMFVVGNYFKQGQGRLDP